MKPLPKRVRIKRNISYKVIETKFDNPEDLGKCDPVLRVIEIKKGLSQKLQRQTLIHEILHAIEFENGIKIPHRAIYQLDLALEEILRLNRW